MILAKQRINASMQRPSPYLRLILDEDNCFELDVFVKYKIDIFNILLPQGIYICQLDQFRIEL